MALRTLLAPVARGGAPGLFICGDDDQGSAAYGRRSDGRAAQIGEWLQVRVRSRLATLLIMVAGPSSPRGKTLVIRRAGGAFLTVLLILIDRRFIPGVYAAKAAIRLERLWETTVFDQSINVLPTVRNAFDRFQFFKDEKSHWVPQRCETSHRGAWHIPHLRKLADATKSGCVTTLLPLSPTTARVMITRNHCG